MRSAYAHRLWDQGDLHVLKDVVVCRRQGGLYNKLENKGGLVAPFLSVRTVTELTHIWKWGPCWGSNSVRTHDCLTQTAKGWHTTSHPRRHSSRKKSQDICPGPSFTLASIRRNKTDLWD
jgi:hypothetical protein